MQHTIHQLVVSNVVLLTISFAASTASQAGHWRQFRGGQNASVAEASNKLPQEWSETKNVAWKATLPGRGPSSPIVVGDRVIVTSSDGAKQERLHIMAFRVDDGSELWRREFWATGRTLTHPSSANAAPTPASDGKHVVAFYSSNDLICLDLDGNLQWYRGLAHDYPKAGNDVGMSSSPLIADGVVVVQVENQGDSFAAGIDVETGTNRWRIPREKAANWSSPALYTPDQGTVQVLLQNGSGVSAHDAKTGEEIWQMPVTCERIPSPTAGSDLVFVPASGLTAISADGEEEPEIVWDSGQLSMGASSPVFKDDRIYTVNSTSVITCAEASTGEVVWKLRLGLKQLWATPVIVGDLIYCVDNEGDTAIVALGDKGRIVAKNSIGQPVQASPAVADNALYLRTDEHLWKIAAP